jgi:hypothetical protein
MNRGLAGGGATELYTQGPLYELADKSVAKDHIGVYALRNMATKPASYRQPDIFSIGYK